MVELHSIVAVDVGSTTTKAILIEETETGYRLKARGSAPTTVEAPQEDVMIGVTSALEELAKTAGRPFMDGTDFIVPGTDQAGADLFIATSSAGGGLQMLVTGLIKILTAESAERAALGAGAIVTEVVSLDDGRLVVDRIRRIREVRPDIVLIAGGTDDGNVAHVLSLAEYVAAARPPSRYGADESVPVVYAGNAKAREMAKRTLRDFPHVSVVDNIRPTLEEEVLEPVRGEIHRLFLEHVMANAPGYDRLLGETNRHVQPTPLAVGKVMQLMARRYEVNVVGVDIGGATTDVFSVIEGLFNRSVSANIGMSYSAGNVFVQATADNILRWLPFVTDERTLRDWTYNKMIRPTTLPQNLDDLLLEHAVGREALRLSFEEHHRIAVELKGIRVARTFDDVFDQTSTGQPLIKPGHVDVIIGSGGLLSHAPRRAQALMLLIDSLQPQGFTRMYVDSVFMMPHLGALSDLHPDMAEEVLLNDCLVPLGTLIAPGGAPVVAGRRVADVTITYPDGTVQKEVMVGGELQVLPLSADDRAEFSVVPRGGLDLGDGPGRAVTVELAGGVVGVVLDGRGRPVQFESSPDRRAQQLLNWATALNAYPEETLARYTAQHVREG